MKGKILIKVLILFLVALNYFEATPQTRKRSKSKTTLTKGSGKSVSNKSPSTSSEAKRRQAETEKEIKLTETRIKENDTKISKGLSDLGKLDQEISKTNASINQLNVKIDKLRNEISTLETSISSNESQLSKLREEYLKAIKKSRSTRHSKSSMAFIFSSKNFSQAMRRMRYLREFSAWRERQNEEITGKIKELKKEKAALSQAREDQEKALTLQRSNQVKLAEQHKHQEVLIAELKSNGKALESHLKKKQSEARELGNLVSQLIAEEQRKAAEEARIKAEEEARKKTEEEKLLAEAKAAESEKSVITKENQGNKNQKKKENKDQKIEKGKKPSEYAEARKRASRKTNKEILEGPTIKGKSFQDMKGRLSSPTTGTFTITSRFGRQNLADLPDIEFDNPGIDAETEAGASARSVFKGKVSGIYLLPGYNTVVIVNHGNYYTVYGNILTPSVKMGEEVEAGTSLGLLTTDEDNSGLSKIHFEVWKNREKQNPQEWLR